MTAQTKIKLYKYASDIEYLTSYCNQEIWLTPVSALNDPFEGISRVEYHSPDFLLKYPDLLEQIFNLHKKEDLSLTKEEFLERIRSEPFKSQLDVFQKKKRPLFENHGVTSFSTDQKNILMWTYYANNHKGFCLEFELDFKKIQELNKISEEQIPCLIRDVMNQDFILSFHVGPHEFVFTKVKYSEVVPVLKLEELHEKSTYQKIEYLIENSIGVKFEQWQHEKEFRIIANSHSGKSGLLPLATFAPFLKFTGLIAGAAMSQEAKNKISKLHEQYKFNYKQAIINDDTTPNDDYVVSIVDYYR